MGVCALGAELAAACSSVKQEKEWNVLLQLSKAPEPLFDNAPHKGVIN